jgi:hypothetical protein
MSMNNNWTKSTFPIWAVVGIFASHASADYPTESVGTNTSTTTLHNVSCVESLWFDGQRLLVGFANEALNFIGFDCIWPDNTTQHWVGQYTDTPQEAWCPSQAPFIIGLRGYLAAANPSATFFTGLGTVCADYPQLGPVLGPVTFGSAQAGSYFSLRCAHGDWASGIKAFVENGKFHVIRRLAARCTPGS